MRFPFINRKAANAKRQHPVLFPHSMVAGGFDRDVVADTVDTLHLVDNVLL